MSRSFSRSLLGSLLVSLLPAVAFAQAEAEPEADSTDDRLGYVEIRAGGGSFQTGDLTGAPSIAVEFDKIGYVIGGAAGLYVDLFGQHLRGEVEVSYREVAVNESDAIGSANGEVGVTTAMLNAYYDLDLEMVGLDIPIMPYLGAGIGVAVPDADFRIGPYEIDDDTTEFAWNVMAGFTGPVSEVADWNLGYRFVGMDDPSFDGTFNGVPTDLELELMGHEVLFGLRFPF